MSRNVEDPLAHNYERKLIQELKFTLKPGLGQELSSLLLPVIPFQQRIGMRDENGVLISFVGRNTNRDVVFDLLGDANMAKGSTSGRIVKYRGSEVADLKHQFFTFAKDGCQTDEEIEEKGAPVSNFVHSYNEQASFMFGGKIRIEEAIVPGNEQQKNSRKKEREEDSTKLTNTETALIPLEYNVARAIKWAGGKFRRKSS